MSWYVAFIVDEPIVDFEKANGYARVIPFVVLEAGVDLLSGPHDTEQEAREAVPDALRTYKKTATWLFFAQFLNTVNAGKHGRLEIVEVTREQCLRYHNKHAKDGITIDFPPRLAKVRCQDDEQIYRAKYQRGLRKRMNAARCLV